MGTSVYQPEFNQGKNWHTEGDIRQLKQIEVVQVTFWHMVSEVGDIGFVHCLQRFLPDSTVHDAYS